MKTEKVPLEQLAGELDELFAIRDWDQDPAMSRWVPRVYQGLGYDHTRILEAGFCERHNGLMLRSGDTIQEVYCAAFPSPDIVESLLAQARGEALLFLHHPVDMEVSGVGFLPFLPADLERLRARGISVYACHAPMDCHDEIGTNASIVEAFDVQVEQPFAWYGNGYAGRLGSVTAIDLEELVQRGRAVFGVDRVEMGGARPKAITQVALVAGGGDDVELMTEAEHWGAQAYITGEWYTRTQPPDQEGQSWAEANWVACRAYAQGSGMALLGFSHAATEHLVMKSQMADYFARTGLPVVCLEAADWWR